MRGQVPKSYKICVPKHFDDSKFETRPFSLKPQFTFQEIPAPPQTTIYRTPGQLSLEDFESYLIEHEHEENVFGRVNQTSFSHFIRKGIIHGYHSSKRGVFLLSGKKTDILDFCKHTSDMPDITIKTLDIDMKALLAKLPEVRLAWFRFPTGMIHASALMGSHLERTTDFKKAQSKGDISTLSFYLEDPAGAIHPIMVTMDGAVVLQDLYQEVSDEISCVLHVKEILLDGISTEVPVTTRRRA